LAQDLRQDGEPADLRADLGSSRWACRTVSVRVLMAFSVTSERPSTILPY
jgi:hypothetical protein